MARTRRQRRANTHRAQARRRRIFGRTEADRMSGNSLACGGKMTPSGEACSCSRCYSSRKYNRMETDFSQAQFLKSWIKVNEE